MNHLLRTRRRVGFFLVIFVSWALGLDVARAQSAVAYGDWQLYLPNNRARVVADAGDRVYVAADDAFFYYDKSLKTTRLLSRRDGLSDAGVLTVAYDSVSQQTLVAYRDGNLDVLRPDGSIQNVTDILRKQITGDKTVNSIYFSGKSAYLSCSFGLLLFDMSRLEVRESYGNIGPGGTTVSVYATTVADGTLFAATSVGMMRGALTDNLLDYRRWTIDRPGNQTGNVFQTVATQNNQVYAGANGANLYVYKGSSAGWLSVPSVPGSQFRRLRPSRAGLLVVTDAGIGQLDNSGRFTLLPKTQMPDPQDVLRAKGGALFIADSQKGLLVTSDGGNQVESFVTNAPANASAFGILADAASNTVDVFSGGFKDLNSYEQRGLHLGFYEYHDGKWTNFTTQNFPDLTQYPNPSDLLRGARTPDGTLYLASYGDGVIQWKGPGEFKVFNPRNSPLQAPQQNVYGDIKYTRVTDLTTDADGNVWVVNRHGNANTSGLHVFSPTDGTWRTLPYFPGSENLDRIVLDNFNGVWVSQARKDGSGVVAYDEASKTVRYFSGSGSGLPSSQIYAVVKDRRGDIWVGTSGTLDGGVAVFNDPSQAFLPGNTVGFRVPTVRTGITAGFPVLKGETVRAIAVDGGNRKWFGTDRGLWLFNEDADEPLLNFTTENSPLPSNQIIDLAVNDRTGEVFVLTNAGLVSYHGNATVTEGKPDCAKVFPNPVRTNFTGEVGISGLANNAVVKITDITGALVYQTRANGGTVTWNLADYNGRKVQSGVYLVLSSDADGKQGCISKIAVVQQ